MNDKGSVVNYVWEDGDEHPCKEVCFKNAKCFGFVTFSNVCYFRGATGGIIEPADLVSARQAFEGSVLYVLHGRHSEPPATPPLVPSPSPPRPPVSPSPPAYPPLSPQNPVEHFQKPFFYPWILTLVIVGLLVVGACTFLFRGSKPREPPPSYKFVRAHRMLSYKNLGRGVAPGPEQL